MPQCDQCHKPVPEDAATCPTCGAAVHVTRTAASAGPAAGPDASHSSSASIHGRFEPGTRLGPRYRIVGLLGRGGMGEVYRADDLELGQSVALKFLPKSVATDPTCLQRFRNEVRTARQIAHPNVCRIYDIAEESGHIFLSMEYIDGEDLAGVLRRMGRPSQEKAIEIARQICLGLAAAHENNVLHRDLKPANIMIDGRGRVRITDFGLAGFLEDLQEPQARAGTPAYMAPEQLSRGSVSVRSDIYSLGLILHELFTGQRVFDTSDIAELKRRHSTQTVSAPSSVTTEIDPAVERVVMRCLESQPEQRPQSIYQVLAALPGGDPLAAALAAGETPSPELVANASDAGGLRLPVALGLFAALLGFMGMTYWVYAGTTVMPQRPPAVLSVVAEQIMEELGYTALPHNSVSGYDVNWQQFVDLRKHPQSFEALQAQSWPPTFRYWRRWSRGPFFEIGFHVPEGFKYDGMVMEPKATASVALDSFGHLIGLRVSPGLSSVPTEPAAEAEWSALFRRANLDRSSATQIPTIKLPTVHCDEVTAWRIDDLGGPESLTTVQMGASGGRANYFEIVGLNEAMVGAFPEFIPVKLNPTLLQGLELFMVLLAWRNLRTSRGDRRNALRCAVVIGALYALLHALASLLQSKTHFDGRGLGHIITHALMVWVTYLAVEPYVRRVWPRMLVGLVRSLSFRWKDPAVGREVLIGVVCGWWMVAMLALTFYVENNAQVSHVGRLPHWLELNSMFSPIHRLCFLAHRAGGIAVYASVIAGLLVAIRIISRHTLVAIGIGILVLGVTSIQWFLEHSGNSVVLGVMYAAAFGVTIVLLFTRVGILSGMVALFFLVTFHRSLAGADSWAAAYTMTEAAVPIALGVYGLWTSLAGQPIFRDLLAEPKPVT